MQLFINTLSNVINTRLVGNKTQGDLAESGIAAFIKFKYDFKSIMAVKPFQLSRE